MLQINTLDKLHLGIQGENKATTIRIDMSAWAAEYPDAVFNVIFQPHDSTMVYPMVTSYDSETKVLSWVISNVVTADAGECRTEIRAEDSETSLVKKSRKIPSFVEPSVTGTETEPPEPENEWVTRVLNAAEDAVEAAEDAETAQGKAEDAQDAAETAKEDAEAAKAAAEAAMAKYPYVDTVSKNWMLWDPESGQWINTGIRAKGEDGATGAVPNITVGTVTTLLPGSGATVERRSGSPNEAPIFDFGIPKGDTGQAENIYGNTINMSEQDTTKVSQAIAGKANKVANAEENNFAALDANGNLKDSGHKHSDYLTQHQDITGKADKVDNATNGNFAALDGNGNLIDGGHSWNEVTGELNKLQAGLDIVINGNTAEQNVTAGQYVTVRNSTISGITDGTYKAVNDVTSGTAFTSADLTPVTSGALNELNEHIGNFGIVDFWKVNYHTGYSSTGATPTTVASGTKNLKKGKYLYLLQMPYSQDTGSGQIQVSIGSTDDINVVSSFNQYNNYVMGIIEIPSDGSYTWSITIIGGGGTLTAIAYNTNRLYAICLQ